MPDPISLRSFTDIRTDRQIGLGDDGSLKETGSRKQFLNRLVDSWSRTDPQREEYRHATESFVQALKSEYGERIGAWASRNLDKHLTEGRPLTGYRVQQIVAEAETARQFEQGINQHLPGMVDGMLKESGVDPDKLRPDVRQSLLDTAKGAILEKGEAPTDSDAFGKAFGEAVRDAIQSSIPLSYAQSRMEDLLAGFKSNYDNEGGGEVTPSQSSETMFPEGWTERFTERYEARLSEALKEHGIDRQAPEARELRQEALEQAFDDVVVENSKGFFAAKEHDDKNGESRLESAKRLFLDQDPQRSPEVQQKLTAFYEKEILPLQEEIFAPGSGDQGLLDVPLRVDEMFKRFDGLKKELRTDGMPNRSIDRVAREMLFLKDLFVGATLTHLGIPSSSGKGSFEKNNPLFETLVEIDKLAREARDPTRRDEMFKDPAIMAKMSELDFRLEQERFSRPSTTNLNERLGFLQGIVRGTAGACSDMQNEPQLTRDVPPYLKHGAGVYAKGQTLPPQGGEARARIEGMLDLPAQTRREALAGIELLDKLGALMQNPKAPLQLRLDAAAQATRLREALGGLLGENFGLGESMRWVDDFGAYLREFAPPPDELRVTQLDEGMKRIAMAKQVLDGGGTIPEGERAGLLESVVELHEFFDSRGKRTQTPTEQDRGVVWMESYLRGIQRSLGV